MPRLALAICMLWFFSLFVFRTIVQWRATGSTGVKGFHGRVGSLPWIAGVAASLGLALAPLAPLSALFDWPGGSLLVAEPGLHWAGAAFALIGNAGGLLAQLAMGSSWRVGVDASERTELVTHGMFAWVRNPIFSFISLSVLGLVLLVPNPLSLLAGVLTLVGIEVQVRAVEEPYLLRMHGADYARYAARVGRFVPAIGRLRDDASRPGTAHASSHRHLDVTER
ncbi:MAG: isoprenylcysteine carboxylmethyltransferase family protein [Deltaproteobacteria bacterium]|nr:isoprenylcysteine carboxylmethyltransferase family protein [Deltaproteobacteria bacterium]MBW2400147.1 isoprenylcysteine carboxylmethyltransferase family protein [Deltaproteobacteria bacterium]